MFQGCSCLILPFSSRKTLPMHASMRISHPEMDYQVHPCQSCPGECCSTLCHSFSCLFHIQPHCSVSISVSPICILNRGQQDPSWFWALMTTLASATQPRAPTEPRVMCLFAGEHNGDDHSLIPVPSHHLCGCSLAWRKLSPTWKRFEAQPHVEEAQPHSEQHVGNQLPNAPYNPPKL